MTTRKPSAVAAGALLFLLLTAAPAVAGPPGKWTRVTPADADVLNIMRPGLARGGDGVLHVTWTRDDGGLADSVLHSSISADAKAIAGPDFIFTGPDGANSSSAVVRQGETLRAFFAAVNQADSALMSATSGDGGRTWLVDPGPVSRGGNQAKPVYAASGIAAALAPAGNVFSAWGASAPSGSGFHIGLDPGDPDGEFGAGTVIDPGVGVDSQTGAAYVAANLLDEDGTGVFSVSPPGARTLIPDSDANQLQHPTHVTGRIGAPGVFVAYTKGSSEFLGKAALWDVQNGRSRVLGRKGDEDVSVAAAPNGRLWVFWRGGDDVRATRSDPSLTKFGSIVRVRLPKGTESAFDLTGEGSAGPLDVLVHAEVDDSLASWHQRILPGLTITAVKKKNGRIAFRVTDAGQPVKGAKVKVKGEGTKATPKAGVVSFRLDDGRWSASASKRGYASASTKVRVK